MIRKSCFAERKMFDYLWKILYNESKCEMIISQ